MRRSVLLRLVQSKQRRMGETRERMDHRQLEEKEEGEGEGEGGLKGTGIGAYIHMEKSFKGRVDQVFGALFQSSTDQGWSLGDGEVRRRQWRREESDGTRENTPSASSFDGLRSIGRLSGNTKRPGGRNSWEGESDSEDEQEGTQPLSPDNHDEEGGVSEEEGRQIRFAVGLDPTLDHEDEEDEYDKVAVGREDAGERTYMREIMDFGPKVNSHNALPSSLSELKHGGRDPRANHLAARARLEEDDEEAAANSDSEMVDKLHPAKEERDGELNDGKESKAFVNETNGIATQKKSGSLPLQEMKPGMEVKSIMKGRQKQKELQENMESGEREATGGAVDSNAQKTKKRVRFEPGCKGDPAGQLEQKHDIMNSRKGPLVSGVGSSGSGTDDYSRVPDYIQNPSKYIHYTLDWSAEDDDRINMQAFKDFSQTLVKPSSFASAHLGNPVQLPKSVTFIPRKKEAGSEKANEKSHHTINGQNIVEGSSESCNQPAVLPVGIAAGHGIENELAALGQDVGECEKSDAMNRNARLQRSARQYRSKAKAYEETGG